MSYESARPIMRSALSMVAQEMDFGEDAEVLGYICIAEYRRPSEGRQLHFMAGDMDDNPIPAHLAYAMLAAYEEMMGVVQCVSDDD